MRQIIFDDSFNRLSLHTYNTNSFKLEAVVAGKRVVADLSASDLRTLQQAVNDAIAFHDAIVEKTKDWGQV